MLKAIRVSAMLLTLVGSAHAGEMLTPPAPQPTPASITQGTTTTDEDNTGAAETLAQIALDVVSGVLSLL